MNDDKYDLDLGELGEKLNLNGPSAPKRVVNDRGENITLSVYQKNKLYDDAKRLREEIRAGLCTRDECNDPSPRNVEKMIKSEFAIKDKIEGFKKRMQALGADPREYNVERFRR